jgi:hypothetical protein
MTMIPSEKDILNCREQFLKIVQNNDPSMAFYQNSLLTTLQTYACYAFGPRNTLLLFLNKF